MKKILSLLLAATMVLTASFSALAASVEIDTDIDRLDAMELAPEWKTDQYFTLADPAPWNLEELKQVVNEQDPRSVAAYFVWAVTRMVDDYDDGMAMMKYLFADIEPYGRGFTEGGMSGKAGWDTYFNERLKSADYKWLPRAYFNGASADNGFTPNRPLSLELYYNSTNTETVNAQSLNQLGRLNIVYWVQSYAGGNQVNITVSKFDGSDRWYVTSGTTSAALFYDQRSSVSSSTVSLAASSPNDTSTAQEHSEAYGTTFPGVTEPEPTEAPEVTTAPAPTDSPAETVPPTETASPAETANPTEPTPVASEEPKAQENPFVDVQSDKFYYEPVLWALGNNVTSGIDETHFGPNETCTRGQVVSFLWRAAGRPEPKSDYNPFVDVQATDYYYKPILWAVENGITAGTSDTTFAPNDTCSSAHIITFLYRAMGVGSNGWYQEAKGWAVGKELLSGTGLTVAPEENCPRSAVVTFLNRIYEK